MKDRVLDKEQGQALLREAIDAFQKFVVFSEKVYYKQDADKANEIGAGFEYFKRLLDKVSL